MGTAGLRRKTLPLDSDLGAHTTGNAQVFQLLGGQPREHGGCTGFYRGGSISPSKLDRTRISAHVAPHFGAR